MISPAGSAGNNSYAYAPLEGIRRGIVQAGNAANRIAQGDVSPQNRVAQIEAEVLVKASVAVLRTNDEILGSILNLKA